MAAFVEAPEHQRGKGDGPDAVIDFFEGDGLIGERDRDKEGRAPGHVAVLIDAADLRMPRILERREAAREGARRGLIVLRRTVCCKLSWGRSWLYSARNRVKRRCCAVALAAGGRAVSALSTR